MTLELDGGDILLQSRSSSSSEREPEPVNLMSVVNRAVMSVLLQADNKLIINTQRLAFHLLLCNTVADVGVMAVPWGLVGNSGHPWPEQW